MKTICITCQKGGVGKTSSCLAIGDGLARRGHKVLYVDLDPQANLSYTLDGYGDEGSVIWALERPKTAKAEVQQTKHGCFILAASPKLALADTMFTDTGREYRLKEALAHLAPDYDVCLLDTPPSLGILTINALTAADCAIIPTQADIYSLQGIKQLAGTVEAVRSYTNKGLVLLGLLVTRFNPRAIIRKDIAELLEEAAKDMGTTVFKSRIRECTAIVEAQAMRKSIFEYAPRSNAAKDYAALVDEVVTMLDLGK